MNEKLFFNHKDTDLVSLFMLQYEGYDFRGKELVIFTQDPLRFKKISKLSKSIRFITPADFKYSYGKISLPNLMSITEQLSDNAVILVDNVHTTIRYNDKGNNRLINVLMYLMNLDNKVLICYDSDVIRKEINENINQLFKNGFGFGNKFIFSLVKSSASVMSFDNFSQKLRVIMTYESSFMKKFLRYILTNDIIRIKNWLIKTNNRNIRLNKELDLPYKLRIALIDLTNSFLGDPFQFSKMLRCISDDTIYGLTHPWLGDSIYPDSWYIFNENMLSNFYLKNMFEETLLAIHNTFNQQQLINQHTYGTNYRRVE